MEWGDDWLAPDKLQHVLACLLIALAAAALATRSSRPFLRRHALALGCAASLAVGAAKEVADEARLFGSSGASLRDAAADILGASIAAAVLSVARRLHRRRRRDKGLDSDLTDRGISMV